ncbi:hypothetical protein [Caulobacter hibisci]|uniref:Nif11 domain-containing protein n=1 Tax=Caulobacter hibisci TaxID=2035993 RepID=A0ABS0SXR4_9CAUL|nr:hypothetical protein [Caulobacter hibisci]MBI1684432.1 hypothetical protein [Caulobacter hibisci]
MGKQHLAERILAQAEKVRAETLAAFADLDIDAQPAAIAALLNAAGMTVADVVGYAVETHKVEEAANLAADQLFELACAQWSLRLHASRRSQS